MLLLTAWTASSANSRPPMPARALASPAPATSQARNCKKGEGNKPNFYHLFCFVNYYKEIKGKDLKDDFECNSCPLCKAPSFARKGR